MVYERRMMAMEAISATSTNVQMYDIPLGIYLSKFSAAKMLSADQLVTHLNSRGYTVRRTFSFEGESTAKLCTEVTTPSGSSLMLLFPAGYAHSPMLGSPLVCSRRKNGLVATSAADISRAYLLRAAREANGLTRVVLTQGKYLTLIPEPFRPGPDSQVSIPTEKYELSSSTFGYFRAIPVVLLEELEQSEDACLRLCEKVSARLHNWLLSEVLDTRDTFDAMHTKVTELSTEYFGKHNDILHATILGMRKGKDANDPSCVTHTETLEKLHAHTAAIRTLCTAMETFHVHMTAHNADLGKH